MENHKFFEKTTDERFIAYFDIMGFKDLVYRNDHSEVKKLMDKVCDIVKEIEDYESKNSLVPGQGFGLRSSAEISKLKTLFVRPVVFSDSILLMSNSNPESDAEWLISVASFFLYSSLCEEVPVKGALSYGIFTADFTKSSFFGRPLIDAHSLADEVHFYGAVLHNTQQN